MGSRFVAAIVCVVLPSAMILAGPTASVVGRQEIVVESLPDLLREGTRRMEAGDPAAAIEVLERAVEIAPDAAAGQALLGRALALDDRYLAAEEALRQAVALGRKDLATWFFLGSTLWENGRLDEAEATFRSTLARIGRNPLLLHQLGRLLLWTGRNHEAVPVLRDAATANPTAADVLLDLARALQAVGDLEAARAAYRRTVEMQPQNSRAHYGLAVVLGRLNDTEEAARELAVCHRLYREEQERVRQEGLIEARIAHGSELVRTDRPHEAIAHLRALPETANSLAALAAAYQATGDRQAAVRALERAVALAPERDDLRTLLQDARLRANEGS